MVFNKREAGFNLVELMVVVAIIGVLSAVAVPRFSTFKARAIQTEAKSGLNALYLSMEAYEANYGSFVGASLATSGFSVAGGNTPKYGYTVAVGAAGWAGKATSIAAIANGATDHQRINTNKFLCPMFDAVANANGPAGCPQLGTVAVAYQGADAAQ